MIYSRPICEDCSHKVAAPPGRPRCKAFPRGIPDEVLCGGNMHEAPIKGQIGTFVFKRKKPTI